MRRQVKAENCDQCGRPVEPGKLCQPCQTPTLYAHRKARAKFRRLDLVFRHSLANGPAHVILIGLAYHAGADGICRKIVPELARWCRMKLRVAERGIADLVQLGEVVRVASGDGRGKATAYLVTLLKPATLAGIIANKPAK